MLQTERLHLYDPREVRVQAVLDYELRNELFFRPWVPVRPESWFGLEGQDFRLNAEYREQERKRSYRFFLSLHAEPQRVLGDLGISNIVRGAFHSAFLGYKLDEKEQGKGYMREALTRALRFAFEDLRLHRIEANIMPRNAASIAVVEALGFRREGYSERYLCINGVWEDHIRYALVNTEFKDQWLSL